MAIAFPNRHGGVNLRRMAARKKEFAVVLPELVRPRMKVLVLAPSYWPAISAGGPARSVTNLVESIEREHEVTVVTSDRDLGSEQPYSIAADSPVLMNGASIYYTNFSDPAAALTTLRAVKAKGPFDVVLLNSFWNRRLSLIPALLIRLRILKARAVVLMPRGELERGALQLKALKKKLGELPFKALYSSTVDFVAATSDSEASNLSEWFPSKQCLLVTNQPDALEPNYIPSSDGTTRLLFFGRIHPTKGLKELLAALQFTDNDFSLKIAGPVGDEDYWEECKALIRQLDGKMPIEVRGTISRGELPALFWSSDLFVTLTMGENFGHTIAESLQASCPVMATPHTPWSDILANGAGVVVADREDHREVARQLCLSAKEISRDPEAWRRAARDGYESWAAVQPQNVIAQVQRHLR